MTHHHTEERIAVLTTNASAVLALPDYTHDRRPGAHLTFSCNANGEVWPFAGYGHTPQANRHIQSRPPELLAAIASHYLRRYPRGGRFRLDADRLSLIAAVDGETFLALRIEELR